MHHLRVLPQLAVQRKGLWLSSACVCRQIESVPKPPRMRPLEAQLAAIADRRQLGLYDSRYHSTQA